MSHTRRGPGSPGPSGRATTSAGETLVLYAITPNVKEFSRKRLILWGRDDALIREGGECVRWSAACSAGPGREKGSRSHGRYIGR